MKTQDEWDAITYENLTASENEEIRTARRNGFAAFYPMFPNWQAQGINTLKGAREWMASGKRLPAGVTPLNPNKLFS